MQHKPLTTKQQYWLDHIHSAQNQGLSLSEYALEYKIPLPSIYKWRWYLSKKNYLNKSSASAFVKVVSVPPIEPSSSAIIAILPNGVRLEIPSLTTTLLAMLQQC
jgi:hypothetical protein